LITRRQRVVAGYTSRRSEDLVFLGELIEAGRMRSVIDRRYPPEQAAEAHRYVETGRKKGNVVMTLELNSRT
jgi:NADPH:quinone reductase-like Zn-dependent oxidoreductase